MANILQVVKQVTVSSPPYPDAVLIVGTQVPPSSIYYQQLRGTAYVVDTGTPAPSDPVIPDPPAPVVTVGPRAVGNIPVWDGQKWVPGMATYLTGPTAPALLQRMNTL